jgi:hypothetical protein
VLRVLAAGRSLDSYIAGGVAINREGPRFSRDIDIFQDSESRLAAAAEADAKATEEASLRLVPTLVQSLIFERGGLDYLGPHVRPTLHPHLPLRAGRMLTQKTTACDEAS